MVRMEGEPEASPLDLYEHMVTEAASGCGLGAAATGGLGSMGGVGGVSSSTPSSSQAFLMDTWVHQLYEQVNE